MAAALIAAMILMGLGTVAHAAISETGSKTDDDGGTVASITHGLTINANDVIVAMIHTGDDGNNITDNNGSNAFTREFQESHPVSVVRRRKQYLCNLLQGCTRFFRTIILLIWY